jgi:hypothetical protein
MRLPTNGLSFSRISSIVVTPCCAVRASQKAVSASELSFVAAFQRSCAQTVDDACPQEELQHAASFLPVQSGTFVGHAAVDFVHAVPVACWPFVQQKLLAPKEHVPLPGLLDLFRRRPLAAVVEFFS